MCVIAGIVFMQSRGGFIASVDGTDSVTLKNIKVFVEVADTPEERSAGLSGTQPLSDFAGMLFLFDTPDRYGFWMSDMTYPIDIFWIDDSHRIVHIEERVPPESYPAVYTPDYPARYVVETKSGFAETFSIKVGDPVTFSGSVKAKPLFK